MTVGVVTLNDITFNDGPDTDGDRFICREVIGWWSTPVELVSVERPVSEGGVVAYGRKASWAVSVVGHVVGDSITHGMRAARKVQDLTASLIGSDGLLSVDDGEEVQALTVRAAGPPDLRRAGPYAYEIAIDLIAVDPTKSTP